ncbi:hypothetical protein HZC35_07470 [Candidatus Saganbacteria bacterium]|nr:hypothetical protein [Candidatus Saganbacteria bacterium]
MPVERVQRFIYRNLVQRPRANRALDTFGNRLNSLLERLGIEHRYATGLTRTKAVLYTSNNRIDIDAAKHILLTSRRSRAGRIFDIYDRYFKSVSDIFCRCEVENGYGLTLGLRASAIFTPKQLLILIRTIENNTIVKSSDLNFRAQRLLSKEAFESLPLALDMVKPFLSSQKIVKLFSSISKHAGISSQNAFQALSNIFLSVKDLLGVEQAFDLLTKVANISGKHTGSAYACLPSTLNAHFTSDHINYLYKGIIDIADKYKNENPYISTYAFSVLSHVIEAGLDPKQILGLYNEIAECARENTSNALCVLPAFFEANLTPDLIIKYIKEIEQETGINACTALPAFSSMIRMQYSPEQAIKLIRNIHQGLGEFARIGFQTIPAALEAKLSEEQMLAMFGKIPNIFITAAQTNGIFLYLQKTLECIGNRLPPKLTLELISHILDKSQGNDLDACRALEQLPVVLDDLIGGGLNQKQIYTFLISAIQTGWGSLQAKHIMFKYLLDNVGINDRFLKLVERLDLMRETALLLNDPQTPDEYISSLVDLARKEVAKSWSMFLNGRPPEELPRVFEFCAKVMAEKAAFAYEKIRTVGSQSRKPTITVYILSTAYKLKVEKLSDQFRERGMTRDEIAIELRDFHQAIRSKIANGRPYLEARLEVGQEWLSSGRLTRFTQPMLLKIPSGSNPSAEVTQKLQDLASLAETNNYDLIFIDHSTVRTKEVTHQGDPTDFEKGRAIARALDIADLQQNRRKWLFKPNNWEIPKLDPAHPNMIGLNLYDGQIYGSHTGGNKSDWLPIDDHGEFIGVSWDAEGRKHRTNYLVITKNGDNKYHVYTAAQIFDRSLRAALDEIRKPKERVRIAARNILFVCNANHDRSPLAEHLMRKLAAEKVTNAEDLTISSAGLEVDNWLQTRGPKKEYPFLPSSGTRRLLDQKSLDYLSFRKQQLDQSKVSQADVIFVMTRRQKRVLLEKFPDAEGKVFVMREYAGYQERDWDIPTPKIFNYQTRYMFEEALERALRRLSGEKLATVRRLPKKGFRDRNEEGLAA